MNKSKVGFTHNLWLIILLGFVFLLPPILLGTEDEDKSLSVFPILMYDTDIGVGYGGKIKLVSFLAKKESFDLILFNSSKGERWLVFTFSIPDFEIRQGKKYALSFDIKAEYDKYNKYYFYGIGPSARKEDETVFTYEKKELQLTLGRGFTESFVIECSYFLKNVSYFQVEEDQVFTDVIKGVGEHFTPYLSLVFRYDTSDSQIHPRKGYRLLFQNDLAASALGNRNAEFYRFALDFRKYFLLLGERDVLAFRVLVQKIYGSNIPIYEMVILGGGSTMEIMRGYKLNRFQDKGKLLANLEYRFPIWGRLGGNLFAEAGSVWPDFSKISLNRLVFDGGWGLRYYLKDFVVRFDIGFSSEGMGIYFNFGHAF